MNRRSLDESLTVSSGFKVYPFQLQDLIVSWRRGFFRTGIVLTLLPDFPEDEE